MLPNLPLLDQGAACGGAAVTWLAGHLRCPPGLIPLAARGLPAVLARASPAGADDCHQHSRRAALPTSIWRAGRGHRSSGAFPSACDRPRRAGPVKAAARRCAMACGQPGPLHHDEIGKHDEGQAAE